MPVKKVQDEGVDLAARSTIDFVGAGVSVADTNGKTTVTISGTAGVGYDTIENGGSPVTQRTTVNFTGAGVSTADSGGKTVVTIAGGGGAPTTADYLVGTADAGLSGEIVVGTTPGGELGGTWASPTVDASHSGSTHAAVQAAAEATASSALGVHAAAADPHTGYRLESASISETDMATTDITTLNATTAKHGFFPKLPNTGGTTYFSDAGTWTTPSAAAAPTNPNLYITTADYNLTAGYSICFPAEYEVGSGFVTDLASTAILEVA